MGLILVLVTLVVYQPVLRAGFVWDDITLITDNRMVQTPDGLRRMWFTTEAPDYYPLTESLWWLEWRAWGQNATGYHVVSVFLHAANAVLVWVLLQRLRVRGAWLAGLVFAVHPVNVASVAWISEQKNTLSMLFCLVAILLYLRFDRKGDWLWYGVSLAACLLALLSKTAVVALPVVLLGCLWWSRGRVRWEDLVRSVPFFVLSLGLGLVTVWFQYHRVLAGISARTDSFLGRLAAAGWAVWFYLYKALLPVNLMVIYPKWQVDTSYWGSYVPGALLVVCFLIFVWKRGTWGRPLLFGLGSFVTMLVPVLGFFDQGFYQYSLVSDHWQYYSIVGVIALVVAAVATIGRGDPPGRSLRMAAGAGLLIVLGTATWGRAGAYTTDETLWRDTLAKNPNAWLAHYNLGSDLERTGRTQEALEQYEQALRVKPDYAEAHNGLGAALVQTGRAGEAIVHFERALQIKPDFAEAHCNLGFALEQVGRVGEAIGQLEQALRIRPDDPEAYNNLGGALLLLGEPQEAVVEYDRAAKVKPDSAAIHNNLATALARTGRIKEAVAQYEQALRIEPDYAQAHYNLARLLASLPPAQGGDPVRAVGLAQRLCELSGNGAPGDLDTLALAYAAAGRFNDASATAERAIELARSAGQSKLAEEIEAHLQAYRDGRAYQEPVSVPASSSE
ncbi:MAG TPA: tetratricopeptide repeat protein [Verrucomicrobiae bacterium]|nr:tetratricopeptide repeat protein [Verrucomicrobiae bacterium]